MLDEEGNLLGSARRTVRPTLGAGRAECDPLAWLDALLEAGKEAAAGREIDAIGVAALGPAPVLVDDDLQPLTPALLFSLDRRADPEALGLTHDHALPKLLWWRDHDRDAWDRAAWGLDATGFLVAQLTGVPTHDGITRVDWEHGEQEPPLPLPDARDPFAVAGGLLEAAAGALGVAAGTPVAVGTYDTYADVLAAGVRAPGDACLLLGSTLVIAVAVAEAVECPGLEATAYLGGGMLLGGWTAAAGSSLDWFARELGEAGDVSSLEPGAEGLLALPYLAGERTPLWDPAARGVVVGLTLETSKAALLRALLDGVALSAKDHVERLRHVGVEPRRWRVRGGGTSDEAWLHAVCDAVGAPLDIVAHATEAVGAAVLAHRAAGRVVELPVAHAIEPDEARAAKYDELLPAFVELYEATAPVVHRLAGKP